MRDFFVPGRSPVYARHGACATSHSLATAEALSVLRAGGSAADACIAACAVQCVVEPHMTGIGGDCFVMVKTPNTPPLALNGSGWSPAGASAATLRAEGITALGETSPLTVTVPGAVAAWRQLHRRYGRLPWRGLFQAAINYADNGFAVAARVAVDWQNNSERLTHDADARAAFLPDGKAPTVGSVFRLPALANTLKQIADDGGNSFYKGDIANGIVAKLRSCGGVHTAEDFAEYAPLWQPPLSATFRGWRVWQCPPNGQGLVALLMLQSLEKEPPRPLDGERVCRFAEITAQSYRWRDANLGESFDITGLDGIQPPMAAETPPHKDTVYLSVIDGRGLAVSFINSIFHPFGSGLYVPDSGVLLHNRGLSFSLDEQHANALAPRKRPMHTIIPAIAEGASGELLSYGVMGAHYQAAGHAWFLSHLLDDGYDVQEALNAPRMFNYPAGVVSYEPTLPMDLQGALTGSGYELRLCDEPLGGGQAVMRFANGVMVAASDCRKDGMAAGF